MQPYILPLLIVFTVTAMLQIGLQTSAGALVRLLENRRLLARSVLAGVVLVPLAGLAATALVPLEPPVAAGICLMALAPGGTMGLQFTRKGDLAYTAALQFLFTLIALFFIPAAAHTLLHIQLQLPMVRLVALVFVAVFLPLLAGRAIQHVAPDFAAQVVRPVGWVSILSFVAAFVVAAAPLKAQAREQVGRNGVLTVLGLVLFSMLVGWLLGGPDRVRRQVLMTRSSVRNAAMALLIAEQGIRAPLAVQAVIVYAALMVPMNFLGLLALRRRRRRAHAT